MASTMCVDFANVLMVVGRRSGGRPEKGYCVGHCQDFTSDK